MNDPKQPNMWLVICILLLVQIPEVAAAYVTLIENLMDLLANDFPFTEVLAICLAVLEKLNDFPLIL